MIGVKKGAYVRVGGQMTWPHHCDRSVSDLQEALGYGSPTREQLYHARSIIGAYQDLIASSQKRRNTICAAIRKAKEAP